MNYDEYIAQLIYMVTRDEEQQLEQARIDEAMREE